jgi:hypothetical protein
MPFEKITAKHRLSDFLVLYDKKTNKPILDPCFSEYLMTFVCGHQKTLFKPIYTMDDQYCSDENCKAMRSVRTFEFVGVRPEFLDYDRLPDIQIKLVEWNPETKIGTYILCKPHKLPNGKWITRIDHMAAPNFSIPESDAEENKDETKEKEGKFAVYPTANYNDQSAMTVYEVPEWALKVPDVVQLLILYLQAPDSKAFKLVDRGHKGDGTFIWENVGEIDPKTLVVPEAKNIS